MPQNIIEHLRQLSIEKVLKPAGIRACWPIWQNRLNQLTPAKTVSQIMNLGDHLSEVFRLSNDATTGRTQRTVSSAGANWEGLVTWYLNLCLINRRTVVIKHNKDLLPDPISDAITVNYNNFVSNSESDIIAITFPDLPEYSIDKNLIEIHDVDGNLVNTQLRRKYNTKKIINALTARDFSQIEIHIIQCKTNWNDNAQIPMLWDMIYSGTGFTTGITIGKNGYSIRDIHRFSYSFATVPTQNINKLDSLYTPNRTCVMRVKNLTGGNYWGMQTRPNVASSIKEMLSRNLGNGNNHSIRQTLSSGLTELGTTFHYFHL